MTLYPFSFSLPFCLKPASLFRLGMGLALFSMLLAIPAKAEMAQNAEDKSAGDVIWVSADGAPYGNGSQAEPFASIQQALDSAKPGDVIQVGPGVFYERVVAKVSGTESAPIILRGTRDSQEQRLTVIEAGRPLPANCWEPAPEIAPGVFKTRAIPVKPEMLTVEGLSLPSLHSQAGALDDNGSRDYEARDVLSWPDGPVAQVEGVSVWDVLGGTFYFEEGVTYIRLRKSENPNAKKILIASSGAVLDLKGQRFLVVEDLEIGGGDCGISIAGPDSGWHTIQRCHIRNGSVRVLLSGETARNRIISNRISMGFRGATPGAWWTSGQKPANSDLQVKRFLYRYFKTFASAKTTSDDYAIRIERGARDSLITDNSLDGGLIGVQIGNSKGVEFSRNVVENFSSVGMALRMGSDDVVVSSNEFRNCNIPIRLHELNGGSHQAVFFGNRIELPAGIGVHIYSHSLIREKVAGLGTPEPFHPEILICHNLFLGGFRGLSIPQKVADRVDLGGVRFLNNVVAGCEVPLHLPKSFSEADTGPEISSNWVAGGAITGSKEFIGSSNVVTIDAATLRTDGRLEPSSSAKGIGKNLRQDATTFRLLPSNYPVTESPDPGLVFENP